MFDKRSKWVGAALDNARACPLIVKKLDIESVLSTAMLRISGLGFFECFINGERVGSDLFVPAFSNYRARALDTLIYPVNDELSERIYYLEYDVRKHLRAGKNSIAVLLGDGYYRQTDRICEGDVHYGDVLPVRLELYLDGSLFCFSDGTERARESFIKRSNLYTGEVQDFSDFSDKMYLGNDPKTDKYSKSWQKVAVFEDLCKSYSKQTCPTDRVATVISPKFLRHTENGAIYDVGRNISGRVVLRCDSERVSVRHAELLTASGELDLRSCGDYQIQEDIFICAEGEDCVFSRFRWSGFRFFEVKGSAEVLRVEEIFADTPVRSEFECSDENINFYYNASIASMRANMHCGIPMDCPHRERLGYTGDGQLVAESALLTLDSADFFKKWLLDIYDSQDKKSGHVQHTAPFCGGGGGPGGWGGAAVLVPHFLYKMTADKSMIEDALPHIHAYIACMESFCEDGIVTHEYEGGWCLGDWCVPEGSPLPDAALVNTYFLIKCMMLADELASELGEGARYGERIEHHILCFIKHFYSEVDDSFGGGIGGSDLFAIDLGLASDALRDRTYRAYLGGKPIDTGIFATELLLKFLSESGRTDALVNVLSRESYPSFGYMRTRGATTLWENWNGEESHDHQMFGAGVKYLFYGLCGIDIDRKNKSLTVSPPESSALELVRGALVLDTGDDDGKGNDNDNGNDKGNSSNGGGRKKNARVSVELIYEKRGGEQNGGQLGEQSGRAEGKLRGALKTVRIELRGDYSCTLRVRDGELPCRVGVNEFMF